MPNQKMNKQTILQWASQISNNQLDDWQNVTEEVLLMIISKIFPFLPHQDSLQLALQSLKFPLDLFDTVQIIGGKRRQIYAILVVLKYINLIQLHNTDPVEFSLQVEPNVLHFLQSDLSSQVAFKYQAASVISKVSSPTKVSKSDLNRSLGVDELIQQIELNVNQPSHFQAQMMQPSKDFVSTTFPKNVSPVQQTHFQQAQIQSQQPIQISSVTAPTLIQGMSNQRFPASPQSGSFLTYRPKLMNTQAFQKQTGIEQFTQTIDYQINDLLKQHLPLNCIDGELTAFFSQQIDQLVKQLKIYEQFSQFSSYKGYQLQNILVSQINELSNCFNYSSDAIQKILALQVSVKKQTNQDQWFEQQMQLLSQKADQIFEAKRNLVEQLNNLQCKQSSDYLLQIESLQQQLSFYKNLVEQQQIFDKQEGIFRVIPKYLQQLEQNQQCNQNLHFQIRLLKQQQAITDEVNKRLSLNPITYLPDDQEINIINPEINAVIKELNDKYSVNQPVFDEEFLAYFPFQIQESLKQYNNNIDGDFSFLQSESADQKPELPYVCIQIGQLKSYIKELTQFVSKVSVFYEQQHINDKHELRNTKQQLLSLQKQILDYQETIKSEILSEKLQNQAQISQLQQQSQFLEQELGQVNNENNQILSNNFNLQQTIQKFKLQYLQVQKRNYNYEQIIDQQQDLIEKMKLKLDVSQDLNKLDLFKQQILLARDTTISKQIGESVAISSELIQQLKIQKQQLQMQLNDLHTQQKVSEKQYEQLELLYKEQRSFIEQFKWIETE